MMEPGETEPTSVWDLGSGRPWACFKSGDLITPKSCHKSEQDVTNLWMIIELFIYLFFLKKTLFFSLRGAFLQSGNDCTLHVLDQTHLNSLSPLEEWCSHPHILPVREEATQVLSVLGILRQRPSSSSPSPATKPTQLLTVLSPSSFGCTPEPRINKDWAATPGLQRLTPVPVKSFSNILFKNTEQRTGRYTWKKTCVCAHHFHAYGDNIGV